MSTQQWNGPVIKEQLTQESRLALCDWLRDNGINPVRVADIDSLTVQHGELRQATISVYLSGDCPPINYRTFSTEAPGQTPLVAQQPHSEEGSAPLQD